MSGYIGVQPVPQATQRREYFTATSGQTTFNTNGYTPGYIDVFMNGVKLSPSDFTATNGSDVVLASGAATGDLLQVISFTPFNVANQTFVGNVNLSSGAYQIGGNNVIDSSRIGSLASLSVGTTNTSAQLVVGDDTDSTATLLQLRNDDSTYSQSWTFSSDTSKDLVITGASGSGGIKLSPGSRGVDVNAGPLKVGGTVVIDSSKNLTNVVTYTSTAPNGYYTHIGSGNTVPGGDEPLFGIFNNSSFADANFSWGFYDSNSDGSLQIWNRNNNTTGYEHLTLKRGGNVDVATGNLQMSGTTVIDSNRKIYSTGATFTDDVAINNGSPELYFGTTGAHYNWRLAAQELVDASFELAVGSQDGNYSDDTYSWIFRARNDGNFLFKGTAGSGAETGIDQWGSIKQEYGGNQVSSFSWTGTGASNIQQYNAGTLKNRFNANGSSYITGGALGIGLDNPSFTLDVSGNARVESTTSANIFRVQNNATTGARSTWMMLVEDDSTSNSGNVADAMVYLNSARPTTSEGSILKCIGAGNSEEFFNVRDSGKVTVNNSSSDVGDFQVKSASKESAFYVDADGEGVTIGAFPSWNGANANHGVFFESIGTGAQTILSTNNTNQNLNLAKSSGYTVGTYISFHNAGSNAGTIQLVSGGTGIQYNTTSDRRLKENIETITDGTAKVMAMNPVTHTWIATPDLPAVHGFIAQEMQEIVPEAVAGGPHDEDMMSMDYGRITPVLVAALQDAHKKIAELETRLTELEGK